MRLFHIDVDGSISASPVIETNFDSRKKAQAYLESSEFTDNGRDLEGILLKEGEPVRIGSKCFLLL